MKNRMTKIVAGVLAAATVLTGVPALGNTAGFTVEAQAAKKQQVYYGEYETSATMYAKKYGTWIGKYDDGLIEIFNSHARSSYTVRSLSRGLRISRIKSSNYKDTHEGYVEFTYEMKKAGTYKLAVIEKSNGKSKTIKTYHVYAYEPKAKKTFKTSYGTDGEFDALTTRITLGSYKYKIKSDPKKILSVSRDSTFGDVKISNITARKGKKGTAKVQVLDYYGRDCGTTTVTVK